MRSLILAVALTLGAAAAGAQGLHFGHTTSLSPFWRELEDNTLSQLVQEALQANTDVHIAAARLTSTRASRRLAALAASCRSNSCGTRASMHRGSWTSSDASRGTFGRRARSSSPRSTDWQIWK